MFRKFNMFKIHQDGDVTVVTLRELNLTEQAAIDSLHNELAEMIDLHQPRKLVLTFTNLKRCSSEVINAALRVRRRVKSYDGRLNLTGMNGAVRYMFRVLNLENTIFDVYDTERSAVDALAG